MGHASDRQAQAGEALAHAGAWCYPGIVGAALGKKHIERRKALYLARNMGVSDLEVDCKNEHRLYEFVQRSIQVRPHKEEPE